MNPKLIFVTGGVASSLGKGIVAASIARLLQSRGKDVTIKKFDPYLNVDPGTLNPYEHGECFVTEDGAETDLDLGHYERFLNKNTSSKNSVSAGKIYYDVITAERDGKYLGKTVQVIPHITEEIKRKMLEPVNDSNIIVIEIGGCVGDIESLPFLEAIRQLKTDLPDNDVLNVHLVLIPYLKAAGELKTKPAQHSVKLLQEQGILPDILVCRTEHPLNQTIINKLSLFCNVKKNCVIECSDADTIYEVPLLLHGQKIDNVICEKLNIPLNNIDLNSWIDFVGKLKSPIHKVNICLIGKYVELTDAYKSIFEALTHAGTKLMTKVNIILQNAEEITIDNNTIPDADGYIIAPGFGERGLEGKIRALKLIKELNKPCFGICLGMQCMVIEAVRASGIENANTAELNKGTFVIDIMPEQKNKLDLNAYGGTMRLGTYNGNIINQNSITKTAYNDISFSERHRHRYEVNSSYIENMEHSGLNITGVDDKTGLVEIVEHKDLKWYIGTQFHPEYSSKPEAPHPLFISFIKHCIK